VHLDQSEGTLKRLEDVRLRYQLKLVAGRARPTRDPLERQRDLVTPPIELDLDRRGEVVDDEVGQRQERVRATAVDVSPGPRPGAGKKWVTIGVPSNEVTIASRAWAEGAASSSRKAAAAATRPRPRSPLIAAGNLP
jgi:hypothetical protein